MVNDRVKGPKISVRIPSYNHEKYIRECLESVLNQTFQDFEIIITDDGSTDRTVEIIREFKDPRIKLEVFEKNRGSSFAVANCLKRASGEYIANLCSDDAWERDKLEKQVKFLEDNPQFAAVFTRVQMIDDDSNRIKYEDSEFYKIFDAKNRSKEEWLNHFFYFGNCLCIPSVLIRKNVYEELNFQDKRMASLSDFDLWIRLCLKYELYILDEPLMKFRWRSNNANASGNTVANNLRNTFEYKQILNNYLEIDSIEEMLKIFPECKKYGNLRKESIPFFLGRLAYDTNIDFKQLWGLETIFNLMEKDEAAKIIQEDCDFSYKDIHILSGEADVYKMYAIRRQLEEIQSLRNINNDQIQDIQALNFQIENLQRINSEQYENMSMLCKQIKTMENTISWKLTKPLRSLRSIQKRLGRIFREI